MEVSIPSDMYIAALPFFILAAASLLLILFSVKRGNHSVFLYGFSAMAVVASLACIVAFPVDGVFLGGTFLSDTLSRFSGGLILCTALVILLFFKETSLSDRFFTWDSVSLFLMVLLGMLVMVSSSNMISLFVGLELSSIGIYILVGYVYANRSSLEGAIKYLILGAFATAFLLFGFALLYASSATMDVTQLWDKVLAENSLWLKIGIVFSLVGLGFKLGLVPFHMWVPDVYESAPTGITAFMATVVKVMILVFALRLSQSLNLYFNEWYNVFFILAVLSMLGANIFALVQTSLKRMLAYSSIAHSGYMAIVLCALSQFSTLSFQAILFYLVAYTLTSLLAFGVLMWLEDRKHQNLHLRDLQGLMKTHPWAALALALSMFSFAGLPPTVGFFAKFFVFNSALHQDLYALVLVGVAGSIIALYYYLRVIVSMFMLESVSSEFRLNTVPSYMLLGLLILLSFSLLYMGTVAPEKALESFKPIASTFLR